jgi:hypothetical protein
MTRNLRGQKFLVYDFRKGEILNYLETGEKILVKDVNGHESRLLKIVPWDGNSAMFIGTDLNFSCGGLEISDVKTGSGIISGNLKTGWQVPVRLSFVIPSSDGYKMKQLVTEPGQDRFFLNY